MVLLSDGDDGTKDKFPDLIEYLSGRAIEDRTARYGSSPSVTARRRRKAKREIAEATNGAYYDATDPETIVDVMNAVVSNF